MSRLSVSGLPLWVPALCILCPAGMWCTGALYPMKKRPIRYDSPTCHIGCPGLFAMSGISVPAHHIPAGHGTQRAGTRTAEGRHRQPGHRETMRIHPLPFFNHPHTFINQPKKDLFKNNADKNNNECPRKKIRCFQINLGFI